MELQQHLLEFPLSTPPYDEVNKMVQNGGALDCASLADTLQNNPPAQCASMYGTWGAVSAATLSGLDSAAPLTLTNSNPTIGTDYTVRHVESFNASLFLGDEMYFDFISGVTPVMTILAPGTEAENQALTIPEVHLNCLKIKSINYTESTSPGEFESGSERSLSSDWPALVVVCVASALMSLA